MADGSRERCSADPQSEITLGNGRDELKECCAQKTSGVKLSFYVEREFSDCENSSGSSGVASVHESTSVGSAAGPSDADDRKKRCIDRYDSSESSDSGVAVLSPTESGGSSASDITEPGSPSSPESSCGKAEEGAGTRMPPWACEPVPPGPRRVSSTPSVGNNKRPPPQLHRRITEYFNHKMKPHTGLKRDATNTPHSDDSKKKCLPFKSGVTHDLEIYISYLSKTLSPRVMLDVGKQAEVNKPVVNGASDSSKAMDVSKNVTSCNSSMNGLIDFTQTRESNSKQNCYVDKNNATSTKDKSLGKTINGLYANKKNMTEPKKKSTNDPSANGISKTKASNKRRMSVSTTSEITSSKGTFASKTQPKRINDLITSTTKIDSKINGVTHGSNNISLNPIAPKLAPNKRKSVENPSPAKRTNRKSSACIANSKNMTWSKANNLKQVELQKQNCANAIQNSPHKNTSNDIGSNIKMNLPNGVRQLPININGNISNINVPVTNFQNCHQINIQQPCNGTVPSASLASFVALPQNVMLAALRIPQNGMHPQTVNQQNNLAAFGRSNVNVSSPTKLNGQFVLPLVQNLNGTMVQIPNLMAKVPNFVLPQTTQMTPQRPDQIQNQQAAQILINGTLLKLTNTMTSPFSNCNKPVPNSSQSIPGMNKSVPGIPSVGMTVQSKPTYTVNFSHPVLVPQPGFIVTSVPNIGVKETWSNVSTNTTSAAQNTSCNSSLINNASPLMTSYTSQVLHTSSIPIAPVKPPDNPIQGTDPPSSTVKDTQIQDKLTTKCDIPWLSKTVNNNNVHIDSKIRPFAQVCSFSEKLSETTVTKPQGGDLLGQETDKIDKPIEEIRRVEEVARREETLFTQITALKDVSSNVQNSVIETNVPSVSTESSESGIGTDKSVDSPSDSQTSKECDEDSSLSLSVSVSSVDVPCQKSPILKQPKTLRFPPKVLTKDIKDKRTSSTDTTSTVTVCMWEDCKSEFENDSDLLEHLQAIHVESQAGQENYVCRWERCKVKGKPSCSRLWLERHAMSHGGNKPFKCIVDGCDRRFSTQILLERHVNNHFNEQSPNTSSGKKASDSTPKLIRRNGKKLRYRRQPWSARMFDFFDAGTMEGLAWRLMRCTRWRLGGACPFREPPGKHTLTLHAVVTAKRYNASEGRKEALVTYYPQNVLEDEWVPEKEVEYTKRVEISEMPVESKVVLYDQFCSSYRKSPSPPPKPAPVVSPSIPTRVLPNRLCSSSRLLNNLMKKKEAKECPTANIPTYKEENKVSEVSGAKKRKQGRRYGGNAFWPCGR